MGSALYAAGLPLAVFAEFLLIVTVLLMFVISMLTKPPAAETVRYTYYGATAKEKAATRESWNGWDVFHSLVVIGVVVAFYICFW